MKAAAAASGRDEDSTTHRSDGSSDVKERTLTDSKRTTVEPTDSAERDKRQRLRSLAIAVALGLLVVLFYGATIVRLGGNVAKRAL
jgi:hypothetical protein